MYVAIVRTKTRHRTSQLHAVHDSSRVVIGKGESKVIGKGNSQVVLKVIVFHLHVANFGPCGISKGKQSRPCSVAQTTRQVYQSGRSEEKKQPERKCPASRHPDKSSESVVHSPSIQEEEPTSMESTYAQGPTSKEREKEEKTSEHHDLINHQP